MLKYKFQVFDIITPQDRFDCHMIVDIRDNTDYLVFSFDKKEYGLLEMKMAWEHGVIISEIFQNV